MRLQREDGVVAIEFALVLPILLLIMFSIIEFGLILYNKQVITNASREGARYGIVQAKPPVSDINKVVKAYLKGAGLDDTSDPVVSCTDDEDATKNCDDRSFGDLLTVSVDYPYTFLLLHRFIGRSASLPLSGITTMVNE